MLRSFRALITAVIELGLGTIDFQSRGWQLYGPNACIQEEI